MDSRICGSSLKGVQPATKGQQCRSEQNINLNEEYVWAFFLLIEHQLLASGVKEPC
jgi:hypothetical protein